MRKSIRQTRKEKFILLWFAISFGMVAGIDVEHTGIVGILLVLFNLLASAGALIEYENEIKKQA